MKTTKRTQWRSLNALNASAEFSAQSRNEFPEGATELPAADVNRRQFLGLMGASAALAGAGLQGCMRKPVEHIVPFSRRPEDYAPGEASFYATSLWVAGGVQPALIRSNDGRPTKLEGNPRSAATRGRSTAFAQAEILRLYDPDRVQQPLRDGAAISWDDLSSDVAALREALSGNGGQGAALLVEDRNSPSLAAQVDAFAQAFPQARVYAYSTGRSTAQDAALEAVGAPLGTLAHNLEAADVVLSLDADFLHTGPDALQNTVGFSARRQLKDASTDSMNRLYVVEPGYSVTGGNADNHLRLAASQIGAFARALAAELGVAGASGDAPAGAEAWVSAVAADLQSARGSSLVIAGERQPAWVHALAMAINAQLGNVGTTVTVHDNPSRPQRVGGLNELAQAISSGEITTLINAGQNPAYDAAGSLELSSALEGLETLVSLSYHNDETASLAGWVIPQAHALETWGDTREAQGRPSVQQPLIEPLFRSLSDIELLALLSTGELTASYDIVRGTWQEVVGGLNFEGNWRRWLHDGVGPELPLATREPSLSGAAALLADAEVPTAPTANALEVNFQLSATLHDGRYANVAWMQEYPHPITKLTWDNAAVVSTATADALGIQWGSGQRRGVENASVVELTVNGRTVQIPLFAVPGVADNVILLDYGYGRGGRVAEGAGVNVRPLQDATGMIATGATVRDTGSRYELASTQDHWSLVPDGQEQYARPLVREADLDAYRENPDFPMEDELMPAEKIRSLWTEPNPTEGQQWGMAIDLTSCIGCGACTIACQAENNIPVVGKSEVLNGREMHWIRIDRYFTGDPSSPELVHQPLGCLHCENAPCEQVCPVAATVHGPEGTNDMVYNRCIGTRYCANNCPYKVRRFNFFNYNREDTEENSLLNLQRNPRVTVRHRGVMEKCSYCVQRINAARIEAKVDGDGLISEGGVQTACQQACPAGSIVFGDINNPNSAIAEARRNPRNYALLSWLNSQPRTTYLAKVRNPNPELV